MKLIAAWFYREYGADTFSVEALRQVAGDVCITIPTRLDTTLGAARYKGKIMFQKAGKGKYKPAVYGEASLKYTYSEKKARSRACRKINDSR